MADANVVEVSGLRFSYGDLEVLRNLTLSIPRGKVVAILGSSGSGKSTLLKLIGGQLQPSGGTVKVYGKNVHQLSPQALYELRLRIGMMFQTSGLFTDLSVYENIAFPIRENFDLPEELVRRIVLMKLHAVGLRGAHAMMPNDLSGGLDPISLHQIRLLIRTLNEAIGLTSIVVTYDVHEALQVADYVYVISEGVVLGKGTPREISASENPYLKQFVNALPDGPVRFHFPGPSLEQDLRLTGNPRGG
jgi:phospholipid/cholesterol/gamma-HCH transport system ATP-binding protein